MHWPWLDIYELQQQRNFKSAPLSCALCAVEEYASCASKINTYRIFPIKQPGMAYGDYFKLSAHNTVSNAAIRNVEGCENLTCFKIVHLK